MFLDPFHRELCQVCVYEVFRLCLHSSGQKSLSGMEKLTAASVLTWDYLENLQVYSPSSSKIYWYLSIKAFILSLLYWPSSVFYSYLSSGTANPHRIHLIVLLLSVHCIWDTSNVKVFNPARVCQCAYACT